MTDQEIITQFEALVDDDLDLDLEIQLLNNSKNKLERELRLEICKVLDESSSTSVGQTYTTAISLPAAFRGLASNYIWVGTGKIYPKRLEDAAYYRSIGGFFYIDYKNNQLRLTGTQTSIQSIVIPYITKTTDITEASINAGTTTVTWPSEFHSIIAYEMVKLFDQIDRLQESKSWRAEWDAEYNVLKNALKGWDADLKLAALGHQTPYGEETSGMGEYQINT